MFAILILQALILQGGDNIEILPNPILQPHMTKTIYQQIAELLYTIVVFVAQNTKCRFKHLILRNLVHLNIDCMTLQFL